MLFKCDIHCSKDLGTVLLLTVTMGFILYLCILLAIRVSGESEPTMVQSFEEIVREKCLEKRGYKALDDNITFFRLVEAVTGTDVVLPCSYCGEDCEGSARVWRWRSMGVNSTEEEVQVGLGVNLTENRLYTLPDHSLTVRNISSNDTGMYYCRSLEEDEMVVFQFNVDLVLPEVPVEKETKEKTWVKYVNDFIASVNKNIYQTSNAELNNLLDKVKLKVLSEWDPWMPCDGCTNIRKRFAKCRIRPKLNFVKYPDINENKLDKQQKTMYHSMSMSCHSVYLGKFYPFLFSLTSKVPNFLQTQPCYGDCLKVNRLLHEPKYYLQVVLNEGDTQFFICPETDLRSKIVWMKDGVVLKSISSQVNTHSKKIYSKIFFNNKLGTGKKGSFVDRMNILHLSGVTTEDTAVYVCYVNNLPVKGFNVTVTSTEESDQQRYYHFWLLSAYSTLLSTIIVITGIVWGYFRKDLFLKITEDQPLLEDGSDTE